MNYLVKSSGHIPLGEKEVSSINDPIILKEYQELLDHFYKNDSVKNAPKNYLIYFIKSGFLNDFCSCCTYVSLVENGYKVELLPYLKVEGSDDMDLNKFNTLCYCIITRAIDIVGKYFMDRYYERKMLYGSNDLLTYEEFLYQCVYFPRNFDHSILSIFSSLYNRTCYKFDFINGIFMKSSQQYQDIFDFVQENKFKISDSDLHDAVRWILCYTYNKKNDFIYNEFFYPLLPENFDRSLLIKFNCDSN